MVGPIDTATLCQSGGNPAERAQPNPPTGQATVSVLGFPSLSPSDLQAVTVTVTFPLRPLSKGYTVLVLWEQ